MLCRLLTLTGIPEPWCFRLYVYDQQPFIANSISPNIGLQAAQFVQRMLWH